MNPGYRKYVRNLLRTGLNNIKYIDLLGKFSDIASNTGHWKCLWDWLIWHYQTVLFKTPETDESRMLSHCSILSLLKSVLGILPSSVFFNRFHKCYSIKKCSQNFLRRYHFSLCCLVCFFFFSSFLLSTNQP